MNNDLIINNFVVDGDRCRTTGLLPFLIPQGCHRCSVKSPFSFSGTGRIDLLPSHSIPLNPFSEPCSSPARVQVVTLTNPPTLPFTSEEIVTEIHHHRHPPLFYIEGDRETERERAKQRESERTGPTVCFCECVCVCLNCVCVCVCE
jgi:hypothetical protein